MFGLHAGIFTHLISSLTVVALALDLQICPRIVLVLVVRPLYSTTPGTPSNAATA